MLDWDALCQQSRERTDISAQERRVGEEAFQSLKQLFGGRFFEIRHPLYAFFLNRAPWTTTWAIWFCQFLHSLKQHPDFSTLVADLELPSRYSERMTVLSMVERLLISEFTIRFDTQVLVNGNPKKPDLFVQLDTNSPGFYVEISELLTSDKERAAADVSRQFFDAVTLLIPHFCFSGRIERTLAPQHLAEVMERVTSMVKRSSENGSFESLEIDGVVRLAIGPTSMEKEMKCWAEDRGMQPQELSGPPYDAHELERLANKLKREQEQLPSGVTNVVAIHSRPLAADPGSFDHFRQIAQFLEEEIYKYPQVGFVAIVFDWMGLNSNSLHRWQDHLCVNRQRFEFICDTTLLLKNRFANPPMSSVLEGKLIQAFTTTSSPE